MVQQHTPLLSSPRAPHTVADGAFTERAFTDGASTLAIEAPLVRGEVALITDGLSESGRAMALGLASLGMDVALVHAPQQGEEARTVGMALLASGSRALLLTADSAPEEVLELAISRTRELLGRLDLVIDNGGLGNGKASARIEVRGLV